MKKAKYTRKDWPKEWQGINSKEMFPYRKYVNRELPGYCGTYSVAALVHFVIQQDRDYDLSVERLIQALKPRIDGRYIYKGTYPWDLIAGLKELMASEHYYPRWHLISNPIVVRELKKTTPYPVIVGTTKAFGSKYGNHWVLVYAFGYNEAGQLFYKAYDNHGKINAVIPASQTTAAIWLERKGEK